MSALSPSHLPLDEVGKGGVEICEAEADEVEVVVVEEEVEVEGAADACT